MVINAEEKGKVDKGRGSGGGSGKAHNIFISSLCFFGFFTTPVLGSDMTLIRLLCLSFYFYPLCARVLIRESKPIEVCP